MCNQSSTAQGRIRSIHSTTPGSSSPPSPSTICAKDIDKPTLMHTLVFYPPEIQTTLCMGYIGTNTRTFKFPISEYEVVLDALTAGKVVKLFGTPKSGGDTMQPVNKVIRS